MAKANEIPTVDEIRERLAPLFDDQALRLVILFGSVAKGEGFVHKRSDVDLAFLYDRNVDTVALTNRVSVLLGSDKVDVVDLRKAGPLLRYAAAKSGRVLHEGYSGAFSEFFSLAFRRYVDTKKLRDAREDSIKRFLRERGLQ